MDKCGIGRLTRTECGSISVKDTEVSEFKSLNQCQRGVTRHLQMLKLRGDDITSEKELILLRAGECSISEVSHIMTVVKTC